MRRFVEQIAEDDETEEENEEQKEQEEQEEAQLEFEDKSFTYKFDIYEIKIYYKNGDTETVMGYGEYGRDEDVIDILVNKELKSTVDWRSSPSFSDKTRTIHPEYLSRDVEYTKVDTEIWEIDAKFRDTGGRMSSYHWDLVNVDSYNSIDEYE